MIDRTLARGLFLAAIALTFGLASLNYKIGTMGRAGPGLFPLMVSGLLGVIALLTIVRSRFEKGPPLQLSLRNIGLLLAALCAFGLVTRYVNMTLGIVAMVFIASFASPKRSLRRSAAVAAGLVLVAFAFKQFLGLNLPLV